MGILRLNRGALHGILDYCGLDPFKANGGNFRASCPMCDDSSGHLYVHHTNGFICFKCGWKGSVYTFFRELTSQFGDLPMGSGDYFWSESSVVKPVFEGSADLPPFFYCLSGEGIGGNVARKYLYGRGVTDQQIVDNHIGYCWHGEFAGRIVFPIIEEGKVVSYVGRSISPDNEPKVMNASVNKALSPSRCLYRAHRAKYFPSLVLTEGAFDALAVDSVDGIYGAVATFGKKLSNDQIDKILTGPWKEIIFAWDQDALDDVIQYSKKLRYYLDTKIAVFPEGEDPSSLGYERVAECIRKSVPLDQVETRLKVFWE